MLITIMPVVKETHSNQPILKFKNMFNHINKRQYSLYLTSGFI